MDIVSLPVDDGSALVLVGTVTEPECPDQGEAPILGSVADFVQQLLMDGALIGPTGNASYDLLKALHRQLQERGILSRAPTPGIDDVRDRVAGALADAGHQAPSLRRSARAVIRDGNCAAP